MSHHLALDLTVPLDRFTLALQWESSERFLGIFGHSGAGKTTVLEAIAGLRRNARGIIRLDGRTWLDSSRGIGVPPERRGVGYVPQEALLFPHRDVLGNLLAGRRRAARSAARAEPGGAPGAAGVAGTAGAPPLSPERVLEVLELSALKRQEVATLSGGEKQRVALGRALLSGPDLLLLDEPLAGLDLPLRRRILPYLVRVREEFGLPTIYVSHDATEIRVLCDEVAVLESGRLVDRGRPDDLFTRPAILPLARADGFENVLRGRVAGLEEGTALVDLEPGLRLTVPGVGLAAGRQVTIALRAEDLILATGRPSGLSAQNILPGLLREIREPGEGERQMLVVVELGRERPLPVVVALTRQACRQLSLRPGLPVHLIAKAQACRVLAVR